MEEVVRTRLRIIKDSVESHISSGAEALKVLAENKSNIEESRIMANKLKALNERFISEMYNYYKLVQNPSADEVSQYTLIQTKAEELVAEIEIRTQTASKSVNVSTGENTNVTTRLPRMELARFDGDVLKWHQFWDQFSSNVDSRNINEVDKLLYLQSVLGGEAKQAIDGLDTTNKNYKIAVETLKERYGKSTTIIDAHYVALYRIQTAGSSIKECRNVLSEIERHLRVLQSLGEDVNHNHLRVMIMEKFPEDLIYELRIKLGSENETIDNIRKNLEYIISARESSNRIKKNVMKPQSQGDSFTLESLHVRTENSDSKKFNGKGEFSNYKSDKSGKFENKRFGNSKFRKRTHESNKSSRQQENKNKKMKSSCVFCDKDHYNDECSNVKSIEERKSKLKGRCYNCLGNGHKSNDCRFKRKCRHCGKFGLHNRALCPSKVADQIETSTAKTFQVTETKSITILQTGTAHVYKVGDHSRFVNCRVLLDCGSQRSYVTDKVVKALKLLIVEQNRLSVFTFGSRSAKEIESPVVNFEIVTRTNKSRTIHANVVPHITESVQCPFGYIKIPEGILNEEDILADDGSRNDQIDILLGNDYYNSFVSDQKIEVSKDLFLINTDFGWIWSGRCPLPRNENYELSVLTYFQSSKEIKGHFYEPDLPLRRDDMKQLWDLESIGIVDSPKSSRDEDAVKNFNDTTQYINNRYHVKWPWVEYPPTSLPTNYGMALGRLTNLIKRLDTKTIDAYDAVLKEQLEQGTIERVIDPTQPTEHPLHYLPHHCVLQEGKTTKLRIVYDASAKTKGNNSLNDCLYRGPLMLEELTGLIIRFREHKIGIVADVEKAFLQIGLQIPDRDVTRFLWIKDLDKGTTPDNIRCFRFCRVPFGIISSPFLLHATVKFHLISTGNDLIKRLSDEIYVDNLITGAQSVTEASALYEMTKKCFEGLSMNIREWNSNCEDFLKHIPDEFRDTRREMIKILGIEWDTRKDELKLKPNYEAAKCNNSKRGVLKVTASIYDPCGFVAPIVLPAKLLLQDLWKQKLQWDDELPLNMSEQWNNIKSNLEEIKNIFVPRLYTNIGTRNNQLRYELHGFADASKVAYAAVVYLRAYDEQSSAVGVSFVLGKSRLAPIKDQQNLQIPRLELLAALIGNRLICYVAKFLRVTVEEQYLWVDSEIVLSWCNTEKLLPPFVAKRVSEIKKNTGLKMRYIPTKMNPADGATRPINSVANMKIWLKGPKFLTQNPDMWPEDAKQNSISTHAQIQTLATGESLSAPTDRNTSEHDQIGNDIIENENMDIDDSNEVELMQELEREGARRGKEKLEEECIQETDILTNEKEREECDKIIKLQKEHFPKEYQGTQTDLTRSLRLFKDKIGLLRCGGRFQNTDWSDDKKFPILLPKNSEFTTTVIEQIHKNNFHIGVTHTLAMVRNKYWIVQGRSQVQKVLKNCLQCRKYGGGPYRLPLMPPLPAERVRYSTPFTFTGIDYFGPLKVDKESIQKCWVCLFTCLAIRAIHMEVVKDLSADECVMAIRRFVAVRGLPQVIISDNATQFKLTSEVMKSDYCIKNKIAWRFIPELAPWFGGVYERLVGITKNCMKRTIDKHLISYNQLCTIIKEIEAVVNTRPLTTVGPDLEHVLTPADFLRNGGPLLMDISDMEFLERATVTKDNLIESWKRGQIILQEFTKMFTSQYLDSLRERRNVHKQSRIVVNRVPQIGDIVHMKSDQNRAAWKLGRISAIITGSDGQIRVAKVTMPSGDVFTRSIGHLYPLEFANPEDEENIDQNTQNKQPSITTSHRDMSGFESDSADNNRSEPNPTLDSLGQSLPSGSTDNQGGENSESSHSTRPKRASAQRARDLVKKWTQQLISLIL